MSFEKLQRKSLRDNLLDKNEYESLYKVFIKYVDEKKDESVLKYTYETEFYQ